MKSGAKIPQSMRVISNPKERTIPFIADLARCPRFDLAGSRCSLVLTKASISPSVFSLTQGYGEIRTRRPFTATRVILTCSRFPGRLVLGVHAAVLVVV